MKHSIVRYLLNWLERPHPSLNLLGAAVLLFLASFIVINEAMAQTAAPSAPTGGVDFSPLANHILSLAIAALTVAAGIVSKFVVSWLSSKTKVHDTQLEQMLADRVHAALMQGIDYAEAKIKSEVADPNSQLKHVQIDNWFVRQAAEYAMTSIPDTLAYFRLTKDRIEDMVRARLNGVMATPKADSGTVHHVLNIPAISEHDQSADSAQ